MQLITDAVRPALQVAGADRGDGLRHIGHGPFLRLSIPPASPRQPGSGTDNNVNDPDTRTRSVTVPTARATISWGSSWCPAPPPGTSNSSGLQDQVRLRREPAVRQSAGGTYYPTSLRARGRTPATIGVGASPWWAASAVRQPGGRDARWRMSLSARSGPGFDRPQPQGHPDRPRRSSRTPQITAVRRRLERGLPGWDRGGSQHDRGSTPSVTYLQFHARRVRPIPTRSFFGTSQAAPDAAAVAALMLQSEPDPQPRPDPPAPWRPRPRR